VTSGYLVGRGLVQSFLSDASLNPGRFLVSRALKIWPSYYAFFALGTLVACAWIPDQAIGSARELPRYLLFYRNYVGAPDRWPFDHVWSLCVEEHFYLALPLGLVLLRKLGASKAQLGVALVGAVVLGWLGRSGSYWLTRSRDTYAGTHNRIDALALGVLLAYAELRFPLVLRRVRPPTATGVGVLVLALSVGLHASLPDGVFRAVAFHGVVAVGCALVLSGAMRMEWGTWTWPLRLVGYFSYNLYLWHPLVASVTKRHVGESGAAFAVYSAVSLSLAVIATLAIEEPIMSLRPRILERFEASTRRTRAEVSGESSVS
jgi:peptidoglycan/LPS O-acetylase OafA/YrhL